MTNAKDIAQEALQSTRAAHHRIDDMKADINEDIKELKGHQTWLWRTALTGLITGFIGLLSFVASFVFKK